MDNPDNLEWGFIGSWSDDALKQISDRVVSIWAKSHRRGVLENLGTGFIVANALDSKGHKSAIVLTAAHIVKDAVRALRPETLRNLFGPFARPIARYIGPLIKHNEIVVLFHDIDDPRKNRQYPARRMSFVDNADLCALVASSRKELPDFPHFGINSDPLPVGTPVILAGRPCAHPAEDAVKFRKDDKTVVERRNIKFRLEIRKGEITRVISRMRLKPVYGYQINIPIPPGMSGSPVFALEKNDFTPLNVVGMCMSGASHEDPYDATKAGQSFVVAAQNFFCLPEPCAVNIANWLKDRRGQAPIGNFFADHGKRSDGLDIHWEPDSLKVERTDFTRAELASMEDDRAG